MKFLLIGLILCLPVHAQKRVSAEVFQSQVRPSLNGIINDFYQMISLFPNFPKEIVEIISGLNQLGLQKENLREGCPRQLSKTCLKTIDTIRSKLADTEKQTVTLTNNLRPAFSPYIDSLSGIRLVSEFSSELTETKGLFDNASLMIRGQLSVKKDTYQMIKEIDELQTMISLAVIEFIPFLYKEEFRHFYFNFTQPIQSNISKSSNFEFMNRNIEALNFSLNLLNQNLTKRNKKTPEGMGPFLSLIHNRWNSLLRYYY